MSKTLKKSKKKSDIDDHLIYIIRNTTPYERLVWLKKAFEFWKIAAKRKKFRLRRSKN